MKIKKKGFTMVELVVVIAVIAILVSIAVPVFVNLVGRANVSKDTATVQNLNTALAVDEPVNGTPKSLGDAIAVLKESGYDFEEITPLKSGEIIYDATVNRFSLLDGNKFVYKGHEETAFDPEAENIHIWRVCDSWDKINAMKTSVYLSRKISATQRAQALTLSALVSIDAGENPYTGTLTIENEGEANIEVRGTFGRVEVDLPNGMLSHYGYAQYMYIMHLMENGMPGYVDVSLPNGTLSYHDKSQYGYILDLQQKGYFEFGTVDGIEWERLHDGEWVVDTQPNLPLSIGELSESTYGSRHRDCSIHGVTEEELYFANAFVNGDFAHTLTNVPYADSYEDYVISAAVPNINTVSDNLGSWYGWDADQFFAANQAEREYNYYAGDGTTAMVFRSPDKTVNTQLVTRIVLFEGFTYNLNFMYMFEGMHKPSSSAVHVLVTNSLDGEISDICATAAYDFQNNEQGATLFHHEVTDKGWTKASCTFTVPNTSGDENTHNPVSYYLYFHLYGVQADVLALDEFTCYPTVQTVENEKAGKYFTHTHASRFTIPDTCLLYEDSVSGNWYGKYVATDPVLNSIITYTLDGATDFNLEFDTEGDYPVTTTFTFAGRTYAVTKTVKVRKAGMLATLIFKDENGNEMFRNEKYRVGDTLILDYVVEKENYRQNTWKDDKGNTIPVGGEYSVADTRVVFTPQNYTAKQCGELLINPYVEENWTGWANNASVITFDEANQNIRITGDYEISDYNEEHAHYAVNLVAGVEYTFAATVKMDQMVINDVGGTYFAVMVKEDRTNSIDYPVIPASNFVLYGRNDSVTGFTENINATWTCQEDGIYYVSIIAWSVDKADITISGLSLRSSAGHAYSGAYDAYCNFCGEARAVANVSSVNYNAYSDTGTSFTPASWQKGPPDNGYDLTEHSSYDASITHTADGSGSVKIQTNGAYGYMRTDFTLDPGYAYEIAFSYKTSADYATSSTANMFAYLVDVDAKSDNSWIEGGAHTMRISNRLISTQSEWYTWKNNFYVTGTQTKNYGFGIILYGVTAGTMWIDDIVVRRISPNENQIGVLSSFNEEYYRMDVTTEDTNDGTATVRQGWVGLNGWRYKNQTAYSSDNSIPGDTSSGSLKFVSKGYGSNFRYAFYLQPGTYTLSVNYKYENVKTVSGDTFIGLVYKDRMQVGNNEEPTWVENFDMCGIVLKSFISNGAETSDTKWQTAKVTFTVDYAQEMYFVFKSNGMQEGSTVWLDNLEVGLNMGENVFTHGSFDYTDREDMLKDGWIEGWNSDVDLSGGGKTVDYCADRTYGGGSLAGGSLRVTMPAEERKDGSGNYLGNVKKVFNVTGGLKYELSFMFRAENITNTANGSAQTAKIKLGKWNIAKEHYAGNWTDNSTSMAHGTTSSVIYQNANDCFFPLLNPAGYTYANGTHKVTDTTAAGGVWNTNGWVKVTFTFDAQKTEPYYLGIMWNGFQTAGSSIYIDEISLRAVGEATDKNVVENGNFLASVYGGDGIPSYVLKPGDSAKQTPGWGGYYAASHAFSTNVSYTADDGSVSLLLKNPSDQSINGGNFYIGTAVPLQKGIKYKISFKMKVVNGSRSGSSNGWIQLRSDTAVDSSVSEDYITFLSNAAFGTSFDWTEMTATFTPKETGEYYFIIKAYGNYFDELYLDELVITPG